MVLRRGKERESNNMVLIQSDKTKLTCSGQAFDSGRAMVALLGGRGEKAVFALGKQKRVENSMMRRK